MSKEAGAVKTLLAVFVAAVALAVVSTGLSWILEKNPGLDGRLDPPRAAAFRTASASCGTHSEAAANGSSENSGTPQRLEARPPRRHLQRKSVSAGWPWANVSPNCWPGKKQLP